MINSYKLLVISLTIQQFNDFYRFPSYYHFPLKAPPLEGLGEATPPEISQSSLPRDDRMLSELL